MTTQATAGQQPSQPGAVLSSEGLGALAQAAQDVMAHQWSNNRQAMDALTRLVDAACERSVMDNKARAALQLLAACVRNCSATYRTHNERKIELAALEQAEAALRA